jgi:hypothetical protein
LTFHSIILTKLPPSLFQNFLWQFTFHINLTFWRSNCN